MSDNAAKKQKRQSIPLDTKIQILNRLATGEGSTSVGKHFGLNEATVRAITKKEARYQELYNGLTKTATQRLITEIFTQNNKSSEMPERLENIDDDGMSTDDSDLVILRKRMRLLPESDSE